MISVIFSDYDSMEDFHVHVAPALVNTQSHLKFDFDEFQIKLATKLANRDGMCFIS